MMIDREQHSEIASYSLEILAENSSYFKRLIETFQKIEREGNAKERDYVAALTFCFDTEYCLENSITSITRSHGFGRTPAHRLNFVLARSHFSDFYIKDCGGTLAGARKIRKSTSDEFRDFFAREPYKYGQSDMWCTLAEWYCLLGLGRAPQLPIVLRDFATKSGVALPL